MISKKEEIVKKGLNSDLSIISASSFDKESNCPSPKNKVARLDLLRP